MRKNAETGNYRDTIKSYIYFSYSEILITRSVFFYAMKSSSKDFYEKLSKKELSDQEMFEAKSNFVGFFDLLYCIDKRILSKKTSAKLLTNDDISGK